MLDIANVLAVVLLLTSVRGLENGLARTPPMGWLSWTRFGCNIDCDSDPDFCISEKLIMSMADRLASDGYKAAGYEYVCIDDCWLAPERDIFHRLQPDKRRFPHGMKYLADYVHSKGLKLGIYEDFGTKTCGGYPGSEFFLQLDAKTFAEWGIDLLKFDTCHSDAHDNKYGYPAMSMYLNQTGRPILFSCEWPYGELQQNLSSDYGPVRETCNIWRNFWDVSDHFDSVKSIVANYGKNNALFQKYSGPGGFFDPDMILAGGFGMSSYQQRAQMSMWAMLSAPLFMSNDLRDISPDARRLLLNPLLLAVDQDPMGKMATKLWEFNNLQLWVKPIVPEGSLAVTFLNTNNFGSGSPISSTADSLGLTDSRGYNVTEVFTGKNLGVLKPTSVIKTRVFPTDAYMIVCILMA
ncbi:AGAL-like protein [Mya arenaria]|uniref:Alpha-galactosidase n=1 Tax=Mya arenaria TaxID=6604 RepID=A0ABY7DT09_MYAAR|nr:alpha-galactosidase A-like [Mya arenaria]WAQ98090.1 AGAL-like protein [Mya arenaria]